MPGLELEEQFDKLKGDWLWHRGTAIHGRETARCGVGPHPKFAKEMVKASAGRRSRAEPWVWGE